MKFTRREALVGIGAVAASAALMRPQRKQKRLCMVNQNPQTKRFECFDLDTAQTEEWPFGDDGDGWSICGIHDGGETVFCWSREWQAAAGKSGFSTEYPLSRTRFWRFNPSSKRLTEVFSKARKHLEPVAPLADGSGMLAEVFDDRGIGVIFAYDWDGRMLWPFDGSGMAKCYAFQWNGDRTRLAFHIAGPSPFGYGICTSDDHGHDMRIVCAEEGRDFFGPQWSPSGHHLLAVATDRKPKKRDDETADICVIDTESERIHVLSSVRQWSNMRVGPFNSASYGSNLPSWCADGSILATAATPANAHSVFWPSEHPVDDHFGAESKPGSSVGGTQIVKVYGNVVRDRVSEYCPGNWKFKAAELPDGSIVYRHWSEDCPNQTTTILRRPAPKPPQFFDNVAATFMELVF